MQETTQEQDRTEQATPFKLEESRKHGDVARSGDFNSFALVTALLVLLLAGGAASWERLCQASVALFAQAGATDVLSLLGQFGRALLSVALPFGLLGMGVAVAATLLQTGPVFSFAPLKPNFERINPVGGLQRLFSRRMLFEAFKSVIKLAALGWIAYLFFRALLPTLPAVAQDSPGEQLRFLADRGSGLLLRLSLVLLMLGLIDWSYVRWQYRQRMMMSRRELKEEIRRREGDPRIRARIRELQRENLQQSRSLGRIPDSDVLITNPDHVGVALRYVRGEMSAPHVIAKGGGKWVERMRTVARTHAIPILERRSLARQLYRHAAIGRPIPVDSYVEVARLYAEIGADRRARTARYEVSR